MENFPTNFWISLEKVLIKLLKEVLEELLD